jgi:hypothetical protein
MKQWGDGMLEYWNIGMMEEQTYSVALFHLSIFPLFHLSIIPTLSIIRFHRHPDRKGLLPAAVDNTAQRRDIGKIAAPPKRDMLPGR